jgi:hypothetical protein
LPWWTDPEFVVLFLRPLSSALIAFEAVVFGPGALAGHVTSFLCFAAASAIAAAIHGLLLPQARARWATLLYVLAGAHAMTTAWIAARHALLGAVFGLLAVYCVLRDQRRPFPQGRYLAAVSLSVGLLASESTLSAAALIFVSEWLGRSDALWARVRRAAPSFGVCVVYLAFYVASGFGTRLTNGYTSPLEAPLTFGAELMVRVPVLLAESFAGIPSLLWAVAPELRSSLAVLGGVAFVSVALVLRSVRGALGAASRESVWLLAGSVASLLPVVATILGGRVLAIPLVASTALVAPFVEGGGRALLASLHGPRRAALRSFSYALIGLHLGLSPLLRFAIPLELGRVGRAELALPARATIDCADDTRVLLVNGADPGVGMYGSAAFLIGSSWRPKSWHVLSMAPHDLELVVEDERSFTLSVIGDQRRSHVLEALYRPSRNAVRTGDRVELDAFRVEVLDTKRDAVTAARFTLPVPLVVPGLCWLVWRDGALRSTPGPGVGERRHVAHEPGPMNF